MTIPKHESTRDKWVRCTCGGTAVACKALTRDRGYGCCEECSHGEVKQHEDMLRS